jgi:DNA polymerase (family 10)
LRARGEGLRVLRGLEMNLDVAGRGDMDPAALAPLDIVVGSFHSALRRSEDQTPRCVAALRNTHVHVIGHPRGRRFNARVGIAADWERVLEVAAEAEVAMETNAFPDRQDLNVELLRVIARTGGWVSIGSDAHNTDEMRFVDIGVAAALRAGIGEDRILNLLGPGELAAWARRS